MEIVKRNFGNTCIFDRKTTKFLRFYCIGYDLSIQAECTGYDVIGREGSTSKNTSIRLNDEKVSVGASTQLYSFESVGENKGRHVIFKLDIDDLPETDKEHKCTIHFTWGGTKHIDVVKKYLDGAGLPSSPIGSPFNLGDLEGYDVEDIQIVNVNENSPASPGVTGEFDLVIMIVPSVAKKIEQRMDNLPLLDTRLEDHSASHLILRANPLLTGNVKITIDSNNDLSLNSFDANNVLSDDKYKCYKIGKGSSYAADLKAFLDGGTMKPEIFYQVREQDYSYTKTNLYEQVDDFYQYGASQCASKYYDEEFQLLAPLKLTKNLPEFFVIFRALHPINKSSYNNGAPADILYDLVKDAEIIKTFDLRPNTKIGEYLSSIVNNRTFNNDEIKFSFDKSVPCSWTGIAWDKGQYAKRNEYAYDGLFVDKTIQAFEKFVTEGFKRNKIVAQDIVNLEFLFDDDTAEEYSVNRYFGLYVNRIDISKVSYSNEIISNDRGQLPTLRLGIDAEKYSLTKFIQYNDSGISVPVVTRQDEMLIDDNIPDFYLLPTKEEVDDKNRFYALIDRDNDMHRIKSCETKQCILDSKQTKYKDIKLYDTTLDMSKLCGINNLKFSAHVKFYDEMPAQVSIDFADVLGKGYCAIPGERFTIYTENSNDDIDKWEMVANGTDLNLGECWSYPSYDISTSTYRNMFNPYGTPEECAKAFAACVNKFDSLVFYAVAIGSHVTLLSRQKDESGNSLRIKRWFPAKENVGGVKFFSQDASYTDEFVEEGYESVVHFAGGTSAPLNVAVVSVEDAMSLDKDFYFQTQTKRYAKIKEAAGDAHTLTLPYIAEPKFANGEIVAFNGYDEYVMIELEDGEPFLTTQMNYISAYDIFEPTVSLLSILPVKDFDTSTHESSYSYIPYIELDGKYGAQTLSKGKAVLLEKNEIYKVVSGSGHITSKWDDLSGSTDVEYDSTDNYYIETYTSDNNIFVADENSTSIMNVKYEEVSELENLYSDFKGFNGLKSIMREEDEYTALAMKENHNGDRLLLGLLKSEYDRLDENMHRDLVYDSKVVPSRVKWVMEGSDVRDNRYRLNMSLAFGASGFSPSMSVDNEPSLFSHEWFYLDSFPEKFNNDYVPTSRGYMYAKVDEDFESKMLSQKVDYFSKYFVVGKNVSYIDGESLQDNTQERYSIVHWSDSLNSHMTMFRGIKVFLRELDVNKEFDGDAKDYEGYKFSAILTISDKIKDPFEVNVLDNKVFKTILVVMKMKSTAFDGRLSYLDLYCGRNMLDFTSMDYERPGATKIEMLVPQYKDVLLMYKISLEGATKGDIVKYHFTNTLLRKGINYDRFGSLGVYALDYGNDDYISASGMPSLVNPVEKSAFLFENTNVNMSERSENLLVSHETGKNYSYFKYSDDNLVSSDYVWMLGGGENGSYIDKIVSFYNFKETLKRKSFKYKSTDNTYSVEFDFKPFTKIVLPDSLDIFDDDTVPAEFATYENVATMNDFTGEGSVMYRYDGMFRPLYKNVISFDADEDIDFCKHYGKDFLLCNTHMSKTSLNSTENVSINKVSDDELMPKLSDDTIISDLPGLELVTITQKDICVANSKWDAKYYKKFTDNYKSTLVEGMMNEVEHKSFLGSTMMNVPDTYKISKFNTSEYKVEIERDEYQNSTLAARDKNITKGRDTLKVSISCDDRFLRELVECGGDKEFNWVRKNYKRSYIGDMDDKFFAEYVKKYLEKNIMPLYEIKQVSLYAHQIEGGKDTFNVTMSEPSILSLKYEKYERVKVTKSMNSLDFKIDATLDPTKHYDFAIVVEIGRI